MSVSTSLVGSSSSNTFGSDSTREHELQPPALTAGQFTDARRQLAAVEAQPLQQLGRGDFAALDLIAALQPAEYVGDPLAGQRGQLITLLVQHRQPDGLAALDAPGVRLDGAGDQSQQGRLPGAVGADDPGALTRGDPPLDVAQHRAAVERDRHVEQIDDVLAQPGGGQLGQLDGVAQRRHVGDQLVGRLDAELGLGGARRRARGAATPAPCASGSAAWPRSRRPCRSRSTRCSTYAAYPPSNGSTIPSCTSQVVVATSSRNQRSWVTISSPPVLRAQRCFR